MRRIFYFPVLLMCMVGAAAPQQASSCQITVAAAADMARVLPPMAQDFEQQSGCNARLVYGSSGGLFAQIENGAPFDVFLSADLEYPRKLVAAGKVEGGVEVYAIGKLVLWSPRGGVEVARGLEILSSPRVARIAMANPATAPYGRAAQAALRHFGSYQRLGPKLVMGENVSQAAQFVESGNAQVGLLPLSFALSAVGRDGNYWLLPADAYPAIEQGAVLLKRGQTNPAAPAFLRALHQPQAQARLRAAGFAIPQTGPAAVPRSSRQGPSPGYRP